MFERYYSFFHYCRYVMFLLDVVTSCRYVMFRKCILSEPKWGGHKQSFGGARPPGPPVATALQSPHAPG